MILNICVGIVVACVVIIAVCASIAVGMRIMDWILDRK